MPVPHFAVQGFWIAPINSGKAFSRFSRSWSVIGEGSPPQTPRISFRKCLLSAQGYCDTSKEDLEIRAAAAGDGPTSQQLRNAGFSVFAAKRQGQPLPTVTPG